VPIAPLCQLLLLSENILCFYVSFACISINQSINQSVNVQSGLSSDATARTTVGVTVKKCHRIMSGMTAGTECVSFACICDVFTEATYLQVCIAVLTCAIEVGQKFVFFRFWPLWL